MSLNLTPSLAIFSCSICHEVRDFAPLNVPTMIFSVHHACAWDKMEHSNCAGLSENGPQKFIESALSRACPCWRKCGSGVIFQMFKPGPVYFSSCCLLTQMSNSQHLSSIMSACMLLFPTQTINGLNEPV